MVATGWKCREALTRFPPERLTNTAKVSPQRVVVVLMDSVPIGAIARGKFNFARLLNF